MKTLSLPILFFLSLSCSNTTDQGLQEFTDKAYFQADLGQSFEKLLGYYQSQKFLSLTEPVGGYTLYPPMAALDDTNVHYTFSFAEHPYLQTLSTKGELVLQRVEPMGSVPELLYHFKSQENALNFIEKIKKDIKESPIVDNYSTNDQVREMHYWLNTGARLILRLTPGLNPGYIVSIKYQQPT